MARPPRINLPFCLYHIMCRGNLHEAVFLINADRHRFLKCLEKYSKIFDFRIHAWCLMDTHVHLLAESTRPNLSEFMRRLLLAYTVWFHRRHNTHGHIFSGRFKSIVVDKASYLLSVSRYIHLNPVEAGFIKRAEDYPWSSMRFYLKPHKAPDFLYTKEVLLWFDGKAKEYAKFVHEGLNEETKPQVLAQAFIGSKAFVNRIKKRQARLKGKEFLELAEHLKQGELIIQKVCKQFALKPEDLKTKGRRDRKLLKCLMLSVYLLRENTEWTFRQIGEYCKVSTVYAQALYRKASRQENIQEEISQINGKIEETFYFIKI